MAIEQVKNYVTYLMVDSQGRYKIGYTKNLKNRLQTFRTVDKEIQVVKIWEHMQKSQVVRYERILHSEFASQNIGGEWFNLTQEQVNMLCKPQNIEQQNKLIDTMLKFRRKFYQKGLTNPLKLCYN